MTEVNRYMGLAVRGKVKWFDANKGYGFILADDGGPDILLHANVLRNFGQSSIAENAYVAVVVNYTDRGAHAQEVLSLTPPSEQEVDFHLRIDIPQTDAPFVAARVKWFTRQRGLALRMNLALPMTYLSMSRFCAALALPICSRARRLPFALSMASVVKWPQRCARGIMCSTRIWISTAAALGLAFSAISAQAACRPERAEIKGDFGTARFTVEIADDPQERAVGLMNRPALPRMAGMLFIYERPQPASFWMENTLIPLDMLFIDSRGQVVHIHENAIPLDRTPIRGGDEILAVLEINGGMSEMLNLQVGAVIRHPQMPQQGTLWPCEVQ